jgi:hypothetical protein
MGKTKKAFTVKMVGKPLRQSTGGFGDAVAVFFQQYLTTGQLGVEETHRIQESVRKYVLKLEGDKLKKEMGKGSRKLRVEVYPNTPGLATVVIHPKD